jgi:NADPH:quinone reductase-like Zn-dependent oxidoreductase
MQRPLPHRASSLGKRCFETAELKAGQKVLIHGATGGVGGFAVQLAHASGILVSIAQTPSQAEAEKYGVRATTAVNEMKAESLNAITWILWCNGSKRSASVLSIWIGYPAF